MKNEVKTESSNEVKDLQRDINKIVEEKQDALQKSEKKCASGEYSQSFGSWF